jgi:hypothetical protein
MLSLSRSIALATPSYGPDYDRCKLLVDSVCNLSRSAVQHHIIVDQRDYPRSKGWPRQHRNLNRRVTSANLDSPFPLVRKAWLSFKTPPIRN